MSEVLAKITVDSKTRQIRDISPLQKHFRFKCKRCATFYCRLGEPMLTTKDTKRIEEKGYRVKDFLEPADSEIKSMLFTGGSLKNREGGACFFFKCARGHDAKQNRCECFIPDFRPIFCRFYPFDFDLVDPNSVVLKLILCCRGLNNLGGKLVDERFVTKNLLVAILERLESEC